MTRGPFRHPLDWPASQPRHRGEKVWGPFKVSTEKAQRELSHELELLGADDVVVSTNVPVRLDGFLYASHRGPDDAGVAVYWTRGGRDFVMACDRYLHLRSNLRACGRAIHHLRRLEQATPAFAEQAFSGFARLPANAGPDGQRPWRDVFGFPDRTRPTIVVMLAYFKKLARERHPDHGGSVEAMAELNRAREEALEELRT